MKTFDESARARIARGYLNSSLDQPAYAAMHGISARTLRDWVCRYGGGRRPHAQLRAAIVASIEHLQSVLVALDAESAADSAAADEDGPEVEERQAERRADSAGPAAPATATAVSLAAEPFASARTAMEVERIAEACGPVVRDIEAGLPRPRVIHHDVRAPDRE